jgi:hypothetical protein
MTMTLSHSLGRTLTLGATAALFAACADQPTVAPRLAAANAAQPDRSNESDNKRDRETERAIETLRRATARYHNIEAAKADHFVLLHDCETRLDNEPVGTVYVNMSRLTDGVISAELPDGLIYEPGPEGLTLVGVELAIPFQLWTKSEPPTFLGATLQREDEFGVFALHAWVWRSNPNGLFAETNPRVTCGAA